MKKTLLTILCTVLVCSCVMGVTLAFLVDKTDSITNTFTIGKVDIELSETTGDTYKMIPGATIAKDPKVRVVEGSEACWLFIKIDEVNNPDGYITYTVDSSWTELKAGVYYKKLDVAQGADTLAEQTHAVLKDNQVIVNEDLTQEDLADAEPDVPKLIFTAYAVQQQSLTVEQAWEQAEAASN